MDRLGLYRRVDFGHCGNFEGLASHDALVQDGRAQDYGRQTQPDERIVHSGKVVTVAGVSAGIDLALWLAGEIVGRERAEAIQLAIEYDPRPPFDAGHMSKASKETQTLAKEIMDQRMPADQRRLVPKIAWRRFIDLIRTGK
ncbi:MAG TPA: hypothetical protein VK604_14255 [Bryobacteraceae bacterium]|nr:hypothetical protein [Bryobacteraceae bacterium]